MKESISFIHYFTVFDSTYYYRYNYVK